MKTALVFFSEKKNYLKLHISFFFCKIFFCIFCRVLLIMLQLNVIIKIIIVYTRSIYNLYRIADFSTLKKHALFLRFFLKENLLHLDTDKKFIFMYGFFGLSEASFLMYKFRILQIALLIFKINTIEIISLQRNHANVREFVWKKCRNVKKCKKIWEDHSFFLVIHNCLLNLVLQ